MKFERSWYWPDDEVHLLEWMAHPKSRGQFMNGRPAYQGPKQEAAMALCRNYRCAVDVGGHVGLWAFNLAHKFKTVQAFEPVAAHRECFASNVFGYFDNVVLHPFALGATEGMVSILSSPTNSGDSRVNGPGEIPMRTLDSFGLADVDLMKIDCEGSELFVLQGAEETIARCKPVVIVEQKEGRAQEYGLGERDALPFLQSLGYKVVREMGGDFICVPC